MPNINTSNRTRSHRLPVDQDVQGIRGLPQNHSSSSTSKSERDALDAKISLNLRPANFGHDQDARQETDGEHDNEEYEHEGNIGRRVVRARGVQQHIVHGQQNHVPSSTSAGSSHPLHMRTHSQGSHVGGEASIAVTATRHTTRRPVDEPQNPFEQLTPAERRDMYPVFDNSGRRIGNASTRHDASPSSQSPSDSGYFSQQGLNGNGSEVDGRDYYRKHVHEYNDQRRLAAGPPALERVEPQGSKSSPYSPSPIYPPSSLPSHSSHPTPTSAFLPSLAPAPVEHDPSTVSGAEPPSIIPGIPTSIYNCINSFSTIQNQPKTPHELLGLPPGVPLNLWSLPDPVNPTEKPKYHYHVLVKLAILGNKGEKATLQDILRAIKLRFRYYENLPKQEMTAFGNSIRHLLSLLAAFVREPKPVTEPGKGAYWRVDFSKGEGNKRVRKRNKRKKEGESSGSTDAKGKGKEAQCEDAQGNEKNADGDIDAEGVQEEEPGEPPASAIEGSAEKGPVAGMNEATVQKSTRRKRKAPQTSRGQKRGKASGSSSSSHSPISPSTPAPDPAASLLLTSNPNPNIDPLLMIPEDGFVPFVQRESDIGAHRSHLMRNATRAAGNPYPAAPTASQSPLQVLSPALTASNSDHSRTPVSPVMALAHSQSSDLMGSPDIGSGHLHLNVNGVSEAYYHQPPPPSQSQAQTNFQPEHHQSRSQPQMQAYQTYSQTQPYDQYGHTHSAHGHAPQPNQTQQAAAYPLYSSQMSQPSYHHPHQQPPQSVYGGAQ